LYKDLKEVVMETERYMIRSRSGWEIESCETLEDALGVIENFETKDEYEGIYTPDFYEVYDTVNEEIVWP
jgi:hypothetical protein